MPPPKDLIKYEEWKRNISKSLIGNKNPNYGKTLSNERKQKLRDARSKQIPWNKGKKGLQIPWNKGKKGLQISCRKGKVNVLSKETCMRMSDAAKKRFSDPEERKKVSKSRKGMIPWNKGKTNIYSKETYKKMKDSAKRRFEDLYEREKISKSRKGKYCGEKSPLWKGGVSFDPYCSKFNNNLKNRVRLFWNYICGECGKTQESNGRKLDVHHVHYDKEICCNDNIPIFIPLCRSCHIKTNHDREYYEQKYINLINKKYNGKSFYTKDEYENLNI